MDFDSAYKFISNQLEIEDNDACNQIEFITIQGKKEAFSKIKCFEDINTLNNNKDLCSNPGLNGEYQVRKMFEKAMNIQVKIEPSYEKKLVQTLLTDYITKNQFPEKYINLSNDLQKMTLSTAIMENTFVDFNNENFLSK